MTGNDWHHAGMELSEQEWAAQVKSARLERGLSKEAAARLADISTITYKRIEDGLPVRDTSLIQVLRTLGLHVDEVVDAPVVKISGEAEAINALRALLASVSDDQQAAVLGRVVEHAVRFITLSRADDVNDQLRVLRDKTRELGDAIKRKVAEQEASDMDGNLSIAAIDADEGDELAGGSEQRGL